MSDTTYLYAVNDLEPKVTKADQFLVEAVCRIPLAWLAIYRPENVRELFYSGATQALPTPIIELDHALSNLQESQNTLTATFAKCPWVPDYCQVFEEFLGKLETSSIAVHGAGLFGQDDSNIERFMAVLGAFANQTPIPPDLLVSVCGFRLNSPLPDPRFLLSDSKGQRDDFWNLDSFLGHSARFEVKTPWEHSDA